MTKAGAGHTPTPQYMPHSLWSYFYLLSGSAFLSRRHSVLEAVANTCCDNIHNSMHLNFYDLMQS